MNKRDYVSPGLATIRPDSAFPRMHAVDPAEHPWKYLRREIPHHWYADERFPLVGVLNRDEATLLHNIALQFKGRRALEIGSWLGWSTCHLALAGVTVDSVDPVHSDPEKRSILEASLEACGIRDRVNLLGGSSPEQIEETGPQWSLFFIDGDHEGAAPAVDARACLRRAAPDCAFVFHDLVSPAVAEGLRVLEAEGLNVLLYQTTQIMGIAWRGNVFPIAHVPDPDVLWQLPHHLVGLPVSGAEFGARTAHAEQYPEMRARAATGTDRPSICVVTNEIIGPFKNGGIGTAMTGLAERMAAAGFPVTVLYTPLSNTDLSTWRARYAELGIELDALVPEDFDSIEGPLRDVGFGVSFLVYKYLSARQFDVIHFNDCLGEGGLVLAAKRLGLGFSESLLVVALHSPSQWVFELNHTLPTELLYAAFNHAERLSVRSADVLWGPSRYLLGWARERGFGFPARTFLQQYSLPTQKLSAGQHAPGPRAAPGLTAPPNEVVFFGRLEERKGLRLFCSAIHFLREELARRQITVTFLGKVQTCGGMSSLDYIASRSAEWRFPVKTITDLGQPEALGFLLEGGKVAVMPSPMDNSPCTVLEALEWGIPFLAARTGGIPELIDRRDHDKVLFDYSTEALGSVLQGAIERGAWVARPSVSQEENHRSWAAMHADWRSLLPARRKPPRRRVVAIVDYEGVELEATLQSLCSCSGVRRVIVLNRPGGPLPEVALPEPPRNIDLTLEDPSVLSEELSGLAGDAVLLIHAGTLVRPEAFATMVRALGTDGTDGVIPTAASRDGQRLVPPLGGSLCFSLFEGLTFTGGILLRGELLAAVGAIGPLVLESPFLGIGDQCLTRGAELLPYPATVFERPPDHRVRTRRAVPGRVAAYAATTPTERYYMVANAFAPPKEVAHAQVVPSAPRAEEPAPSLLPTAAPAPPASPATPVMAPATPAKPRFGEGTARGNGKVNGKPPIGDFARVGPVHFQPLEQELHPVAEYLRGDLLNAGCGFRDISPHLLGNGALSVTRYDIASSDPQVILGPLEAMPFVNGSFDSVLCNAVLEHVVDAEKAILELARVTRPGGHVVVAVPFLQPFHPCPGDYRRYTAAGLRQLGTGAGLEVVAVLPVHSFAQTIGWLLWEYAEEKGGRFRRAAAWSLAFAATRLSHRTDEALVKNANTFQAVFRKPGRIGDDWRERPHPAACAGIPTMLLPDEHRLLNHLAEDYYTGAGCIIDAGAFLASSTVALADGLRRNLARRHRPEEKLIHSFDRFEVEDWTRGVFFPESARAGDSFRAQYDANIAPFASLIEVNAGDISCFEWNGGPIEILFIDVAKHWQVCDWVTWQFFRHLIPGRSIVIQQDYLFHHWVAWIHITMEYYADYFEYLCDTEQYSVAFLYTKKIPESELRRKTVEGLSFDEKVRLMDRAVSRFQGAKRELLLSAKKHFVDLLQEQAQQVVASA